MDQNQGQGQNKDKVIINDNTFYVMVSITENEHSKGLKYYKWPPPAMLFYFKEPGIRRFWMKDTPSKLDIIYIINDKIDSIYVGEPFDESNVGPEHVIDHVLELPYGTCQKHDINIGDRIEFKLTDKTKQKIKQR